jgi:hypothetical protein
MRGRRGFADTRRRPPVTFGPYGFLRPPRRHEEEQRRFLERVRDEPKLRREYRASLAVQMGVVGALLLACAVLVVQSALLLRSLRTPSLAPLAWMLPGFVALLALVVLRRFLRLLADYRRMSDR